MSKAIAIERAFDRGKAIMVFLTAGDPSMDATAKFIREIDGVGVDLIEIGIPFSDPVAEIAETQAANIRALEAGANTDSIFDMLSGIRTETTVPILLKTYLNPVFHYGYENFCKRCMEVGISGLVVPDMPFEERKELAYICEKFSLVLLSAVAPAERTRIEMISRESRGFIYISAPNLNLQAVVNESESQQADKGFQRTLSGIISCIGEETRIPTVLCVSDGSPQMIAEAASKVDGVMLENFASSIICKYKSEASKVLCEYISELKKLIK